MSAVCRCDICGEIFEGEVLNSTINIYDYSTSADEEYVSTEYENLDLCPECTKKLQNFIYVLQNYPNNYVIHVTEEGVTNAG